MPSKILTPHDANIVSKIKDPEFSAAPVLIDPNIRRDPHIRDMAVYESIVNVEKAIIKTMVDLEQARLMREAKTRFGPPGQNADISNDAERTFRSAQTGHWLACILRLNALVEKHPDYASARNNRVQALRVVYGDGMLVELTSEVGIPIPDGVRSVVEDSKDLGIISKKTLDDLDRGIELLSPQTRFSAVSTIQANTLAKLYLHRGALYLAAAKKLARDGEVLLNDPSSKAGTALVGQKIHAKVRTEREVEQTWSSAEFERNASLNFMMAGRYGSEIGKGMAVSTNPDAKLCGQIVAEAMRKEIAGNNAAMQSEH